MTAFLARRFAVARFEDINTLVVAFASNADGSGDSIELQRAIEADEQDAELGMDTYCICLSGGATHYGGIEAYALSSAGLRLELTAAAAAVLNVERRVEIQIDLLADELEELRQGLAQVLADTSPR